MIKILRVNLNHKALESGKKVNQELDNEMIIDIIKF